MLFKAKIDRMAFFFNKTLAPVINGELIELFTFDQNPFDAQKPMTGHLPVLQELHSPKPAQGNETERTSHELVPDSDVHRYRGIPEHHALSRGRKINGPTHVFITVCPYNNTL
jgi:hypothetical protein